MLVPAEHRSCTCISWSIDSRVAFPALQSLAHSPAVWWSPDKPTSNHIQQDVQCSHQSLWQFLLFLCWNSDTNTVCTQTPTSSLNTEFIGELQYVHLFYAFIWADLLSKEIPTEFELLIGAKDQRAPNIRGRASVLLSEGCWSPCMSRCLWARHWTPNCSSRIHPCMNACINYWNKSLRTRASAKCPECKCKCKGKLHSLSV